VDAVSAISASVSSSYTAGGSARADTPVGRRLRGKVRPITGPSSDEVAAKEAVVALGAGPASFAGDALLGGGSGTSPPPPSRSEATPGPSRSGREPRGTPRTSSVSGMDQWSAVADTMSMRKALQEEPGEG
jgi:hypothetical protein